MRRVRLFWQERSAAYCELKPEEPEKSVKCKLRLSYGKSLF